MPLQHEDNEFREDGTIAFPVKHGEAGEKFDAMPIAWLGLFFRCSEGLCASFGCSWWQGEPFSAVSLNQ